MFSRRWAKTFREFVVRIWHSTEAMTTPETKQEFEVDGIKVSLVRDAAGAHWECSVCRGRCEHILKAAASVTPRNWAAQGGGIGH